MGLTVVGALPPTRFGDLNNGDVFVLTEGGGYMVAMKGSNPHERLAIVFGSVGTAHDATGAGWISAGDVPDQVFKIDSAMIVPERGPLGFPIPADTTRNGSLVMDGDGVAWLFASPRPMSRAHFRLSDGAAGNPISERTRYNNWRIIWRPDPDPRLEAVTLLAL
jgi:hypothetical protein